MSSTLLAQDGSIPFSIPSISKPCHTYYKTYGNLNNPSQIPLIVLHGGPGVGHDYMLPFQHLWALYKIPVIFYDQIGCGQSTLLPEKVGDEDFWSFDLFLAELKNVIEHFDLKEYHLLGHSWGGRVVAELAAQHPPGLKKLILGSTAADGPIFVEAILELKDTLSASSREAIDEAIRTENFESKEYQAGMLEFTRTYMCRSDPFPPPELAAALKNQATDFTVRKTLQGPSPFMYVGPLARHTLIPVLPKIEVPTLVWNGEFDTTQEAPTRPFVELIPRVRWVTMPGASHMSFLDSVEQRDKTLDLVAGFLR